MPQTRRQAAASSSQETVITNTPRSTARPSKKSRKPAEPQAADLAEPDAQPSANRTRPNAFLDTKSRGATVAASSPSVASRKRRRDVEVTSSTAKRAKTTRPGVNAVAMDVLNTFNRKTRGRRTAQQERGSNMRPIIVGLEKRSASQQLARIEEEDPAEVESRVEESYGDVQEQLQEEIHQHRLRHQSSASRQANLEEAEGEVEEGEVEEDEEEEEEAAVELETPKPGRSNPTTNPERVPPRSGQGVFAPWSTQEDVSPQKSPRRSQRRVPKVAFGDRRLVEEPPQHDSTPRQSRISGKKSAQGAARINKASRGKQSSRSRAAAQRAYISDDEMFVAGEAEEEEEEEVDNASANDGLPSKQASQPTPEDLLTIHIRVNDVKTMCNLMGKEAWTFYGRNWVRSVMDPRILKSEGLPASSWGKKILAYVDALQKDYRSAPRAHKLSKQTAYLEEKSERIGKIMIAIGRRVDNICDEYQELVTAEESEKQRRSLLLLKRELVQCALPLLVLLLREVFQLGGVVLNANGDRDLLPGGGDFTATTCQLLETAGSWIVRLASIVRTETELGLLAAHKSKEDEGTQSIGSRASNMPQKKASEWAKQRIRLEELARSFQRTVRDAQNALEEQIERQELKQDIEAEREARSQKEEAEAEVRRLGEEAERQEKEALEETRNREAEQRRQRDMERAAAYQTQKEREEQELLEKRQRHQELVGLSTQRLRHEDYHPLRDKWEKAEEIRRKRAAEYQRAQAQRQAMGSPVLGSGVFDDAEAPGGPSPVKYTGKKWRTEEMAWVLAKLKEGGRPDYDTWAEVLECRVDEVKQEVHVLKLAARNVAQKKGHAAPAWALTST